MSAAELFELEPDTRLEDLRDWIRYQWAFRSWFGCWWPTEAHIVTIAGWFKVLCETVINECGAEFIRRCDKQAAIDGETYEAAQKRKREVQP
jgi:hypothetical protein